MLARLLSVSVLDVMLPTLPARGCDGSSYALLLNFFSPSGNRDTPRASLQAVSKTMPPPRLWVGVLLLDCSGSDSQYTSVASEDRVHGLVRSCALCVSRSRGAGRQCLHCGTGMGRGKDDEAFMACLTRLETSPPRFPGEGTVGNAGLAGGQRDSVRGARASASVRECFPVPGRRASDSETRSTLRPCRFYVQPLLWVFGSTISTQLSKRWAPSRHSLETRVSQVAATFGVCVQRSDAPPSVSRGTQRNRHS